MLTSCEHCDAPVLEGVMRGTGRTVLLDPEPLAVGNLQLHELGHVATFIPKEYRDPTSRWFVPPTRRYQSHAVTCAQNQRTCPPETTEFIAEVDRRIKARM